MTLTQEFSITLTEPVNLRDLGGLPVADGVVATGFAIRADDLSTITAEAAERLVDGGLKTVVDLRSRDEVFITGRGPLQDQPVTYHHAPLLSSVGAAAGTKPEAAAIAAAAPNLAAATMPPMSQLYVGMFEQQAAQLVHILAGMAHSPGATAFHCAAGKDRTGTLAAALLLALGADDDVIIADYQATYPNLEGIGQRTRQYMGQVMAKAGYDAEELAKHFSTAEETKRSEHAMTETLHILRERYTDPLFTLRQAGLTNSLIDALRARAVTA